VALILTPFMNVAKTFKGHMLQVMDPHEPPVLANV
jgi:hypothetical protein